MAGTQLSRRGFLRLAGAAAGVVVLAACQPKANVAPTSAPAEPGKEDVPTAVPQKAQPVKLVWLVRANERENQWEENVAIPEHQAMYPNVTIELMIAATASGAEWVSKIMSLFAGGTPPDAFNGTVGTFIQLYAEGKVLDLSPYIGADNFDLTPFGALVHDPDMCRSGKQMAMPILTTSGCPVYYNMDLFDEAGLEYPPTDWKDKSWSWDKVLEYAQALTKNYGTADAVYGIIGGDEFHYWAYVFGTDCWKADWYSRAGVIEEAFDVTDSFLDGMRLWQDQIYKYKVRPTPSDSSAISQLGNPFKTGRVAMEWTGGWGYWNYSDIEEFRWGVAPTPWGVSNKCINWTDPVLSPKEGKHNTESWQLIKYLTSKEGQIAYAKAAGTPPTREDAIEPWVEYMVSTKCGLTADQFRQVALGYRDNYMDNWAHYVIRAGEYQQIQTQYRDLLLNNEQKPEELFPTIKEKMDEVAKSVFAEYQNTPLGEDTLCAPLKR